MKGTGRYLRGHLPKTYYFLIALINLFKRVSGPYTIYITDSLGGSFKEYLAGHGMMSRIPVLKRNLDKESVDTVDVIVQRLLNYPDERFRRKISRRREITGGLLPVEKEPAKRLINEKLKGLKKGIRLPSKYIEESVFYFYHGLTLLPDEVIEYIRDQDFIDAGAFIGDSAIALREYRYRRIYSIEMSQKSIERYRINLANCGITPDKFEIINAGLASNDNEPPERLWDTGSSGLSFLRKSGKYDEISVEKKSLDSIVNKYKIVPRFIKVDIEGNSLEFVKGAGKTLIKFRPVLSIAIYHNPYEFFEVKPMLESLLTGYVFIIRKLAAGIRNNLCHSEVILLGYPKEVIPDH